MPKSFSHTVRTRDEGTRYFKHYGRRLAMAIFCTECLGWEEDPKECTAPLCPLFPFRTKSLMTQRGSKKSISAEEDPF